MCGLFCVVKKNRLQFSERVKSELHTQLRHRGPDSCGTFEDENILLLHARLKIVDLSKNSTQPFFSKDRRFCMVYTGECYNYKTIRSKLESLGHTFKTEGDTEVILNAFQEWGASFVDRIAGMFSIVIYDSFCKKVHVFRDRMGIKPLYIAENEDGIFLSSEIRPLLKFFKSSINQGALWSYFNLRFTHGEATMFEGIEEVAPGTHSVYSRDGRVSLRQYWDSRNILPIEDTLDVESFNSIFSTVLSEHNIGDTSVAALLSGGVDSASIVAQSAKLGFNLETFTFSTGVENDELSKAQKIASKLGFENFKCTLGEESFGYYREAIRSLEDPLGDSIILPTMLLAQEVAKKHKVVLAGEGADEIFSGYIHHQVLNLEELATKFFPNSVWALISKVFGSIPQSILEAFFPYPAKLGVSGKLKVQEHIKHIGSEFERYISLAGVFEDPVSRRIFNKNVARPAELENYWNSMEDFDFADRLKRFDLRYWARNYTLHRLEKLSMRSSLEGRVPFFDHRIIELILKVKSRKIYNLKDPKRVFRNCLSKANLGIDNDVIKRKKQAFYLPTGAVFSSKTIRFGKEAILDNARNRGIYDLKELEHHLRKDNLELLDSKQFQCLYNFELWCQEFID